MPPIGNRYWRTSSSYSSRLSFSPSFSRSLWKFPPSLALLHWSKTFYLSFPLASFTLFSVSRIFIASLYPPYLSLSVSPPNTSSWKVFQRALSSSRITAKFFLTGSPPASPSCSPLRYQLARSKSILATTISIGPSITMNVIVGIAGVSQSGIAPLKYYNWRYRDGESRFSTTMLSVGLHYGATSIERRSGNFLHIKSFSKLSWYIWTRSGSIER